MAEDIWALTSDWHLGHGVSIWHPETKLMDEHGGPRYIKLTATQEYIYAWYLKCFEKTKELAAGDPITLVLDGDLIHGDIHKEHLQVPNISDQVSGAVQIARGWYEDKDINLSAVRILIGTAAHSKNAMGEKMIATRLQEIFPKVDTSVSYHLYAKLRRHNDEAVDVAHHGPNPGTRVWTEGNSLRSYVRDRQFKDLARQRTPPRLFVRGHYHTFSHETVPAYKDSTISDIVILPAFTGIDDYVRRVTGSKDSIDIGMVAAVFEDGFKHLVPMYEELDVRTCESL